MSQTIEINGRTILYFALTLLSFSLFLYLINKYDKDRKIEKLELTLNELDRFQTEEIQTLLLSLNLDSLKESEIEALRMNFSSLDNEDEFNNLYRQRMQILIKDDTGYHTLNYGLILHDYNNRGRKFISHKNLSKKEEEIIEALEKTSLDVHTVIKDNFSFLDSKKIIYPIAKNDSKNVYLKFSYFENQ